MKQVALSQSKALRRLAVIDKNRDLYITPVQGSQELYKLHIMVDSVRWNDADNALAAVADGQVLVWHYPEVVYMDRDLLPQTISKQSPPDLGKTAEIIDFRNTRVQVRRSDGAVVTFCVSPYPSILEKYCAEAHKQVMTYKDCMAKIHAACERIATTNLSSTSDSPKAPKI